MGIKESLIDFGKRLEIIPRVDMRRIRESKNRRVYIVNLPAQDLASGRYFDTPVNMSWEMLVRHIKSNDATGQIGGIELPNGKALMRFEELEKYFADRGLVFGQKNFYG